MSFENPMVNEVNQELMDLYKVKASVSGFYALGFLSKDAPIEWTPEQEDFILSGILKGSGYESTFLYSFAMHLLDLYSVMDEDLKGQMTLDELIVRTLEYQGIRKK